MIIEWCYKSATGTQNVSLPISVTIILNIIKSYRNTTDGKNAVTPNELSTWSWTATGFSTYQDFNGGSFIIIAC